MTINIDAVLDHIGMNRAAPSKAYLDALLLAWSKSVPWESVSRIARHKQPGTAEDYVWWPKEYLENAVTRGTGGTCFESNYAFKAVLDKLGFVTTLHFCDMPYSSTHNPHCALIVQIGGGQQYLVDVGYPIPGTLPLVSGRTTSVQTPVYTYHATGREDHRWLIDRTSGDFEQCSFVLKSQPVALERFRDRMVRDHGPRGLFLDEVILQKIVSDNEMLRWSSKKGLVRRRLGIEETVIMEEKADLPRTLSRMFGMDRSVIAAALGE